MSDQPEQKKPTDKAKEAHEVEIKATAKESQENFTGEQQAKSTCNDSPSDAAIKAIQSNKKLTAEEKKSETARIKSNKIVLFDSKDAKPEKVAHKASKRTPKEDINESQTQLKAEARNNPALEPVAAYRDWAESLPDSDPQKQPAIEQAREQACLVSPTIAARYRFDPCIEPLQSGVHQAITPDMAIQVSSFPEYEAVLKESDIHPTPIAPGQAELT